MLITNGNLLWNICFAFQNYALGHSYRCYSPSLRSKPYFTRFFCYYKSFNWTCTKPTSIPDVSTCAQPLVADHVNRARFANPNMIILLRSSLRQTDFNTQIKNGFWTMKSIYIKDKWIFENNQSLSDILLVFLTQSIVILWNEAVVITVKHKSCFPSSQLISRKP